MGEEQEVDVVLVLGVLASLMWKTVDKVAKRLMNVSCGERVANVRNRSRDDCQLR